MKVLGIKLLSIMLIGIILFTSITVFAGGASIQWAYIDFGQSAISDLGNCQVVAYGSTDAWDYVDYVGVTVHLQMFYNGQWNTIHTDTYGRYNFFGVSGENVYTVQPYASYRVCSEHTVIQGDYTETVTSECDSIVIVP